jgi:hypothetical protein
LEIRRKTSSIFDSKTGLEIRRKTSSIFDSKTGLEIRRKTSSICDSKTGLEIRRKTSSICDYKTGMEVWRKDERTRLEVWRKDEKTEVEIWRKCRSRRKTRLGDDTLVDNQSEVGGQKFSDVEAWMERSGHGDRVRHTNTFIDIFIKTSIPYNDTHTQRLA